MTPDQTAILQLFKRTITLKELPRTGAIIEGATRAEADTIASHSHSVSVLACIVAHHLATEFSTVDPDRVASMAVLHDLAECVTGDLPASFKRLLPDAATLVESRAFAFLFGDLACKAALLELVSEYESGLSADSKIVRFADAVDAYVHLKLCLGKEFSNYLDRAEERLRRGDSDSDGGVGLRLAAWLDVIRHDWDQVVPKLLPQRASKVAGTPPSRA